MLTNPQTVAQWIEEGKTLLLAGDETLLSQLPRGNWIGGTIPYFMSAQGGTTSRHQIFANELPPETIETRITTYDATTIPHIAQETPETGFCLLIIPCGCPLHYSYAREAATYREMFLKPIIGWIAGVHLEDLGTIQPKVFNGKTGQTFTDQAIAMHVGLPPSKLASINVINIFQQGNGDSLTFPQSGFQIQTCHVNGIPHSFPEYIRTHNINTQLPLVANYSGTLVNVSLQKIFPDRVDLYAPVFESVEYRFASPIENYPASFEATLSTISITPAFSCNCILNYLYGKLEGQKTASITGPITFGEIACQLLNQTLVCLEINDA